MAEPLSYLHRVDDDWLVGGNSRQLGDLAEQLFQKLIRLSAEGTPPKILLAQRDPIQFLAGFVAACAANYPVFLGNPNWAQQEWQQVCDLVQPNLIWCDGSYPLDPQCHDQDLKAHRGWIMVPTGGSMGQIRFAIHTWSTLMASVQGFQQYFQLNAINSCCVLPLYHVSGLMQFLRSLTSRGRLVILPFRELASLGPEIDPADFLSLVPTQLQRLLQNAANLSWLSRFQTVLLGGAPAWPELLESARRHCIRLAPTYGMTETASQIATLKPTAFLAGNNSCGRVLPHAKVVVCSPQGEPLGPQQTGVITVQADSLALGYYPVLFTQKCFQGDDLGFFDAQGNLTIVGRSSSKIITGGENVFPAEVEAAIRATHLVTDVCVIGIPDQHWGQVITAIYVPQQPTLSPATLEAALHPQLSKFKYPKHWIALSSLPRNAQGKVNQEQLRQTVLAWQQRMGF